jgi:hypothetical protein
MGREDQRMLVVRERRGSLSGILVKEEEFEDAYEEGVRGMSISSCVEG